MYEVIFLIVLAFAWIVFATFQDLKNREIADWLNFSLIIFALGFRFFYCLFSESAGGFSFFYQGLIGLGIFFILGNLLYYLRSFAGGDAKLMIALGAILPFSINLTTNLRIFAWFFFLFLALGAVYGLVFSLVLGLKNFKKVIREFVKVFRKEKIKLVLVMFLGLGSMAVGMCYSEFLFFSLGILIFLLPYLYVYAKSVDEVCMIRKVGISKLSEGDWLVNNLKLGKRLIKANWDGLTADEIKLIKKYKKDVLIRSGIPFTPAFLFSFLTLVLIYLFKIELLSWIW